MWERCVMKCSYERKGVVSLTKKNQDEYLCSEPGTMCNLKTVSG